jgi:hypothetical protein
MIYAKLTCITTLVAGCVLSMGTGTAWATDGTSPQAQADALGKMVTSADVPSSLLVDPGWEFTTKVDRYDLRFELCTKNGVAIEGLPAPIMHQVEFGETDLLSDPISVQQNIWQFTTPSEAKRAWRVMQARAKDCSGTTKEPGDSAGKFATQVLTNGTTRAVVNGQPGIWTHSLYRSGVTPSGEGGYYVAFLLDDAIQTVEYDFAEGTVLPESDRWPVKKLAQTLANRWLAGGSTSPPAS